MNDDRFEAVVFFIAFGALVIGMTFKLAAEALKNAIRDVVDDYPVYSVVVCFGIGLLIGIAA